MSGPVRRGKPSLLEAGLPCASLSAECQRDNNARQRPPQNRLHIWWARRPPTVCRAAILGALLPHDLDLPEEILPPTADEPSEDDLDELPRKMEPHRSFFERLLKEVPATQLTKQHQQFLKALGVAGDSDRAYRRMALREEYQVGSSPILLPMDWTYRHEPAFTVSPSEELLLKLTEKAAAGLGLSDGEIVVADHMAGGGAIPVEAVRYGYRVFANELNPVAAVTLKATIEYPARFGSALIEPFERYEREVDQKVRARLIQFFYTEPPEVWWPEERRNARLKFSSRQIEKREPAQRDSRKNCSLWARLVPCSNCGLNIPLSTNFHIVKKKGKPEQDLAAFPQVPPRGQGNDCTFRIVHRDEWAECRWPRPDFTQWHPTGTPTFKDGKAICPRCGHLMEGDEVKAVARSREGGLAAQLYAVCSQVPVKVTYRGGRVRYRDGTEEYREPEVKTRWLWRFRAPRQEDLHAVAAAETELRRLLPQWEAKGLVPNEEIPEGDKTREPRNMGIVRFRDFFLPRQLLTNLVILEEIRAAQERAKADLPADQAEAVGVYLAFILDKVVSYNNVCTTWHSGRKTVRSNFSGHDYRFEGSFCEFEGARETVQWGASQVINAYEQLAALIHGEPVELTGDDEETGDLEEESEAEELEDDDENTDYETPAVPAATSAVHIRPEVIVPTVTCEDAAALSNPPPGSVHLICVDPPYYHNVQYSELANFFYVWMKRSVGHYPSLEPWFREPLTDSFREAVANEARYRRNTDQEASVWQAHYEEAVAQLRSQKVKAAEARKQALASVGPRPASAKDRAHQFYQEKMAQVFRRSRQLLHPSGRLVVMFNHKQTWAWQALGMSLITAGFEIRSSAPILTEAPQGLNIRGLDAARSTILLLCLPREETDQPVGNWASVQGRVGQIAAGAAAHFQKQGLAGTDLYLSALGPALGEVAKNWPVTDFAGRPIDLIDALEEAYRAVGRWRLSQIFEELTQRSDIGGLAYGFSADAVDRDTQALWLWLDTFLGEQASSDDVRKLAKSLNVDPDDFKRMSLLSVDKDTFILHPPQEVDLKRVSRRLLGDTAAAGRASRAADIWEERTFPGFVGAAVWNAIALMVGTEDVGDHGVETLKRWLRTAGYGDRPEFIGAFAVTLDLLERVFGKRPEASPWGAATRQARRAWDLVLKTWRG